LDASKFWKAMVVNGELIKKGVLEVAFFYNSRFYRLKKRRDVHGKSLGF
jgi:hypothetical protein